MAALFYITAAAVAFPLMCLLADMIARIDFFIILENYY